MEKKITNYRNAKTGKFVSKKFAENNPKTTVKENNTVKDKKDKK